MNLKEEILVNSGLITEMAKAELDKVLPLIRQKRLKEAAIKYIEIGGKPAGVSKTVGTLIRKGTDIPEIDLRQFAAEVVKLGREKGIKNPRSVEHNTVQVAKTKKGIEKFKVGHSPEERNKKILQRIAKVEKEIKKEMDALASGNEENQKWVAKEILKDIDKNKDKEIYDTLYNFVKYGKNKVESLKIMKTIVNDGANNIIKLKNMVINYKNIKPDEKTAERLQKVYQKIKKMK